MSIVCKNRLPPSGFKHPQTLRGVRSVINQAIIMDGMYEYHDVSLQCPSSLKQVTVGGYISKNILIL